MNLWLRLMTTLLAAWRGEPIALPGGSSRLTFRVWPHDLDPSMHMNNGRYLAIMDLGRLDVIARSGLLRLALRQGWTPIASTVHIRFQREMRLLNTFDLITRLVCWDVRHVVMEQTFLLTSGPNAGQIAAKALFKGGIYDRKTRRFVTTAELMTGIGVLAESPPVPEDVAAFLQADEAVKRTARADQA